MSLNHDDFDEKPRIEKQSMGERPSMARFVFLGSLVLVFLLLVGGVLFIQQSNQDNPKDDMRAFALAEKINNNLGEDIETMQFDEMKLYSQAACVEARSAEQARHALRLQLRSIPEEAREGIVTSAIIDKVSHSSASQDTSSTIKEDGNAFSHYYYYSTKYREFPHESYSSCVAVSGVDMKASEVVAEYVVTKERKRIGVTPCHCGFLFCLDCPEYAVVETKTPIFKRHALKLETHMRLHEWMVAGAVEKIQKLLGETSHSDAAIDYTEQPHWNEPKTDVFLGSSAGVNEL